MKEIIMFSDIKRSELVFDPTQDPFKQYIHKCLPQSVLRVLLEFPWQFLLFVNDAKLIIKPFNWKTRVSRST